MKKLIAFVMMICLCCSTAALAQEKKGSVLSDWLKAIQKKIEKVMPKKTLPQTNVVAGVRGEKQDSQMKLYWKGEKHDDLVTEEELGKFKAGIDLAGKGNHAGAVKELEDFMKQYPDSVLVPDVKKTLDLAKLVEKDEKKEAVTDEKKEAVKEEKKD